LVYLPAIRGLSSAFTFLGTRVETVVDGTVVKGIHPLSLASQKVAKVDNSLEGYVFQPVLNKMRNISYVVNRFDNQVAPLLFQPVIDGMIRFARACAYFDDQTLTRMGIRIAESVTLLRDGIYEGWLRIITVIKRYWQMISRTLFFSIIKVDYDHKNEKFFQKYSMMNLDLNFIIIIVILLLALGLGFIVVLF